TDNFSALAQSLLTVLLGLPPKRPPPYFRNLAIKTAPAKHNTAENQNAAFTETCDHNTPTTMLDRKSPTAFTAASVPNAMPCCSFGKSSAASESSSASSVPTYTPASTKIAAKSHSACGAAVRNIAVTPASA